MVVADLATVGVRLPEIVGTAVDHGARAVVLRAREASSATRVEIARQLRQVLSPVDGLVIVAGTEGAAVHLSAKQEFPESATVPCGQIVPHGRRC